MKQPILTLLILLINVCACTSKSDELTNNDVEENVETPKPNILLIIADDMGVDATPRYNLGTAKPNMPNLESLMDDGVKFNNVWSYAVCTPARASIITGKYGFRTGVTRVGQNLSTNEISIQKHLDVSNSGYAHAVIGKWHLGSDASHPNDMGVATYAGLLSGGVQSYWDWSLIQNGASTNSNVYTTTKFTDLAIDWIDSQTKPWFLWLAYNAPHTPFHLPDGELHNQTGLPSDDASINANPLPYYMAMLEAMDSEMGRLLDAMPQEERDNTIIIFIGDNGTPNRVVQEFPNRRAKNSIYEGGIRVPMIISGKHVTRKGEEENAILNTTDLFSTIAAIAESNTGDMSDSKNFEPMLNASALSVREHAYAELDSGGGVLDYAIRNNTYKYIRFSDGDEAFYNLEVDPSETNNLLDNPSLTTQEATHKASLEAALEEVKQ